MYEAPAFIEISQIQMCVSLNSVIDIINAVRKILKSKTSADMTYGDQLIFFIDRILNFFMTSLFLYFIIYLLLFLRSAWIIFCYLTIFRNKVYWFFPLRFSFEKFDIVFDVPLYISIYFLSLFLFLPMVYTDGECAVSPLHFTTELQVKPGRTGL